jgi:hypothetical protein
MTPPQTMIGSNNRRDILASAGVTLGSDFTPRSMVGFLYRFDALNAPIAALMRRIRIYNSN